MTALAAPSSNDESNFQNKVKFDESILSGEESKDSLAISPANSTAKISAGTVMLKSIDERYIPHAVSIESGNLVICSKQDSLGIAPVFHPLDSISIQSSATESQGARKRGSHMVYAQLRISNNVHRTLCFINYSQMCAKLRAIHCKQGFDSSF